MCEYSDVCRRVAQYRYQSGFSQEQMANILDMTQENYSHIENGKVKIAGSVIRDFFKLGWDIDYIITGRRFELHNDFSDTFMEFEDKNDRSFASRMIAELMILQMLKTNHTLTDEQRSIVKITCYYLRHWDNFSMFAFIRTLEGVNQTVMAGKLGVSYKTYGAFERETKFPDALMLMECYNQYGYQPSLYLKYFDRKAIILNSIWENFDNVVRSKMNSCINNLKDILE